MEGDKVPFPTFDGTTSVSIWIYQVESWFRMLYPGPHSLSDHDKAVRASFALRGEAATWYGRLIKRKEQPTTYDEFVRRLTEHYEGETAERQAYTELLALRYDARRPERFFLRFEELAERCPSMSQNMLMDTFRTKLPGPEAGLLVMNPPPSIEVAIARVRELKGLGGTSSVPEVAPTAKGIAVVKPRVPGTPAWTPVRGSRARGGKKGTTPTRGGSSSYNLRPTACHRCGQEGHWAKDCPTPVAMTLHDATGDKASPKNGNSHQ